MTHGQKNIKLYRGIRGIAPFILNLGTRCRWVSNFMSRPLLIKYELAGCAPESVWKLWKKWKFTGPGMVKPAGFVTHFVVRHTI